MMLPSDLRRSFGLRTIAHSKNNFTDERLASMDKAGLIHFGGHGHPDRIDDGLTAAQIPRLELAPCVVFNGACYTGVTSRWFDETTGVVVEKSVAPAECFCLNLLQNDVIGYLAAVHPDHGMPVYQEIEFMAIHGASLGDAIKQTHDGVVMGAGGKLPQLKPLAAGNDAKFTSAADVMLRGTAARILFGDPALIVGDSSLVPPFSVTKKPDGDSMRINATVTSAGLKSTFTDTYHNDLNPDVPFNDRALLEVELPRDWDTVSKVEVVAVKSRNRKIRHRLVGHAVEHDSGGKRLHVQVDVEAEGFQQSALRVKGATVELVARRK
jgi:hypothetical protein